MSKNILAENSCKYCSVVSHFDFTKKIAKKLQKTRENIVDLYCCDFTRNILKKSEEKLAYKIVPKFSDQSSVDTSRNSINVNSWFRLFCVHLLSIYHQLWSHLGSLIESSFHFSID